MSRLHSFPPLASSRSRLLVLGSLPGEASLKAGEYYAHPRNAFWDIMGALVGASRDLPYAQRVERLDAAGIAVWDVLHSAERQGSLDSAILEPQPNDLTGLLERFPLIRLVATNGSYASNQFARLHWPTLSALHPALRHVRLPSSSPANARLGLAQKIALWRAALEPDLDSGWSSAIQKPLP